MRLHCDKYHTYVEKCVNKKLNFLATIPNKHVWCRNKRTHAEKHGGGSVMMWVCFSSGETEVLVKMDELMNCFKHLFVLTKTFQVFSTKLQMKRIFIFKNVMTLSIHLNQQKTV